MNWRNAVAIALTVVAWALRLCAIALCVLTVLLCFSRMAARLGIINLVLDITQALPSVISGYGLMATPMGGVFRLDFAIMAVVLFLLDYLCMFFSRKVRQRMGIGLVNLLETVLSLAIAMVIHESAHALAAYVLGDKTARERGRVSLNPLNHIDPFGTIILPLIMYAAGGVVFAFAKPVPVAVNHLKNPKRDEVLVSLAGPASNLLLAGLAALVLFCIYRTFPNMTYATTINILYGFATFIMVNLGLCFFNLIPLPPLDGSSIIVPFLNGESLRTYYQIQRYSMPILIILLYFLPRIGIDLVGFYYDFTVYPLYDLLVNFALSGLMG